MNAFFEFLKWLIKVTLVVGVVFFAAIAGVVYKLVSKRKAEKEEAND